MGRGKVLQEKEKMQSGRKTQEYKDTETDKLMQIRFPVHKSPQPL